MKGPFLLEAKTLAREIDRALGGAFLLCDLAKVVRAVGRSDRDLPADLLKRVGGKDAVWFYYEYAQNPKEAFEMECKFYHQYLTTLTRRIHPVKPEGKDYKCPLGCR